ncbi:hypothetical protein N657DRAFT_56663 [Parathielavia appendiculata]|uniref:Uncharacterized protein n=1 Tax=Parathielavia appendiculata TaxID=2587402 RepID=A0AAN6UCN6_9PEZI|nr:hypothetical protein N657DRAFT_56663 [Parathielavia appendiculata]
MGNPPFPLTFELSYLGLPGSQRFPTPCKEVRFQLMQRSALILVTSKSIFVSFSDKDDGNAANRDSEFFGTSRKGLAPSMPHFSPMQPDMWGSPVLPTGAQRFRSSRHIGCRSFHVVQPPIHGHLSLRAPLRCILRFLQNQTIYQPRTFLLQTGSTFSKVEL